MEHWWNGGKCFVHCGGLYTCPLCAWPLCEDTLACFLMDYLTETSSKLSPNLLHLLQVIMQPVVTRDRVTWKLVGSAGFGPSSRLSDHNPSYPNLFVINMFLIDWEVSFLLRTRKLEFSKGTWLTRGHIVGQHKSWVFLCHEANSCCPTKHGGFH